jgi:hypothetical protein
VTARKVLGAKRQKPLVVTISDVPIFCEAIAGTLADQAYVHPLKPIGADTEIVLRALNPDAVIVDSQRNARRARKATLERGIPLIHLDSDRSVLRVLGEGGWRELSFPSMTSDALQGLLRAVTFGAQESD